MRITHGEFLLLSRRGTVGTELDTPFGKEPSPQARARRELARARQPADPGRTRPALPAPTPAAAARNGAGRTVYGGER